MIQRYTVRKSIEELDPAGRYVLYADHAREIAAKDAEIARLREALDVEKKPKWVLLSGFTSASGKSLWACSGCGLVTPCPSKNHECAALEAKHD